MKIKESLDGKTVRFVHADPIVDGGGVTLVFAITPYNDVGSPPQGVDDKQVELVCENATLKGAFLQLQEALALADKIVSETLEDIGAASVERETHECCDGTVAQ